MIIDAINKALVSDDTEFRSHGIFRDPRIPNYMAAELFLQENPNIISGINTDIEKMSKNSLRAIGSEIRGMFLREEEIAQREQEVKEQFGETMYYITEVKPELIDMINEWRSEGITAPEIYERIRNNNHFKLPDTDPTKLAKYFRKYPRFFIPFDFSAKGSKYILKEMQIVHEIIRSGRRIDLLTGEELSKRLDDNGYVYTRQRILQIIRSQNDYSEVDEGRIDILSRSRSARDIDADQYLKDISNLQRIATECADIDELYERLREEYYSDNTDNEWMKNYGAKFYIFKAFIKIALKNGTISLVEEIPDDVNWGKDTN